MVFKSKFCLPFENLARNGMGVRSFEAVVVFSFWLQVTQVYSVCEILSNSVFVIFAFFFNIDWTLIEYFVSQW